LSTALALVVAADGAAEVVAAPDDPEVEGDVEPVDDGADEVAAV
jgi:hypothetical protein